MAQLPVKSGDGAAGRPDGVGSGLMTRIISALVLAPVALLLLVAGGWPLAILISLAAFLMFKEWDAISGGVGGGPLFVMQSAGIVAAILCVPVGWADISIFVLVLTLLVVFAATLKMSSERGLWPVLGTLWIGLPSIGLMLLSERSEFGHWSVLWLVFVVWACDIGAYFAGRGIGGPKLLPSISPKKTWAGLLGGVAAAAVVGAVLAGTTKLAPILGLAVLSGIMAAVSQIGDLSESAFKRHFGVKDSGSLIPGHGGILDRVDGLLFAIVFAVFVGHLFGGRILPWL